jgi:putative ABC transport system permease protein
VKYLVLVAAAFRRHPLRSVLTVLSVLVAFLLFGYLAAIRNAFAMGVEVAGADRLVVRHKVSIIQMLPISYQAQMESIPGVAAVTHATWFGGIYQDPRNFFGQFPVEPEAFLDMYPEFLLPEEQLADWLATRTGAVAGRTIADRYGWKVGDRIPIQATIWRPKEGSNTWEFDLVGIYEGAEKGTDTSTFLFRRDYFEETRAFGAGSVGWYYIRVADPEQAVAVAAAVDERFANSPAETKTEPEGAFVQAFADQMGNIGAIVTAILAAVFFTILLVAGNTMAQSVRERIHELGVLKALGFDSPQVLALVLAESCLLALLGGGLGLTLAWHLIALGDPTGGALPIFYFPVPALVTGAALALALGLAAGLLPALQALRLRPVDALRRG